MEYNVAGEYDAVVRYVDDCITGRVRGSDLDQVYRDVSEGDRPRSGK